MINISFCSAIIDPQNEIYIITYIMNHTGVNLKILCKTCKKKWNGVILRNTVKPRYNHIRLNAISDFMHYFQINGWLQVLSMPKRLDTVHSR